VECALARIDIVDCKLFLEISRMLAPQAKKIPGAYFVRSKMGWVAPREMVERAVALFPDLPISDIAQKYIAYREAERQAIQRIKTEASQEPTEKVEEGKLYQHQKTMIKLGLTADSFGFFLDMGLGKTRAMLEILRSISEKALVVAPLTILNAAWMEDRIQFTPEIPMIIPWAKTKKNRTARVDTFVKDESPVVGVINYESFRLDIDQFYDAGIKVLVLDESSKIKAPRSLITKALLKFSRTVPRRFIMSGTPAPNTLLEYFTQMKFLDPSILGTSFVAFRNKYFFPTGFGGYQWEINDVKREALLTKIAERSIWVRSEDHLDLPEQTDLVRDVMMSPTQVAAYKQFKKDLILQFGDVEVIAPNVLTEIMKLRQIVSGALIVDGRIIPIEKKPPKLMETDELVNGELKNRQVIIWTQFHFEGDLLMKQFSPDAARLDGTVSPADKQEAIESFRSGRKRLLIAHPRTAGHGLTFVNSSYVIYYSLDYSYEAHEQSRKRIHRIGQTNNCFYIYLLGSCDGKNTIDHRILSVLRRKTKLSEMCKEFLRG